MIYEITETDEFRQWYLRQSTKTRTIITARLDRLQSEGSWGFVNRFENLIELKWTSGMRIYTSLIDGKIVIILAGGNKNGQSKDIKKAKKLLKKFIEAI